MRRNVATVKGFTGSPRVLGVDLLVGYHRRVAGTGHGTLSLLALALATLSLLALHEVGRTALARGLKWLVDHALATVALALTLAGRAIRVHIPAVVALALTEVRCVAATTTTRPLALPLLTLSLLTLGLLTLSLLTLSLLTLSLLALGLLTLGLLTLGLRPCGLGCSRLSDLLAGILHLRERLLGCLLISKILLSLLNILGRLLELLGCRLLVATAQGARRICEALRRLLIATGHLGGLLIKLVGKLLALLLRHLGKLLGELLKILSSLSHAGSLAGLAARERL